MRKTRATLIIAAIMLCALLVLIAAGPAVSTENSETAGHTIKMPSGEILTVLPIDPNLPRHTMTSMRAGTTVVLEENFDNLPNEGLMPDGWYTYDEDGDGFTWVLSTFEPYEGDNCIASAFWGGGSADNWLVTDRRLMPGTGREFAFYAKHFGSEQAFEIWMSETGHTPMDFVFSGDLVATDVTSEEYSLHSYWIDPDGFMPTDVWVGIRCVTSQPFNMFVDSITWPNSGDPYVGFEGPIVFPPQWWTQEIGIGMGQAQWSLSDGTGTMPAGVTPHSGEYMAQYDSWNAWTYGFSMRLRTPALNFEGYDNLYLLHFWMYHDDNMPSVDDKLTVQVSTDGVSWTDRLTFNRYSPTSEWREHSIYLHEWAGDESVYIGFLAESQLGNGIYIDDITITREASPLVCAMLKAEGTISSYIASGTDAGEGYFTYFDPEEECGSPYPFELGALRTSFMDPGGYTWPVEFDVVIYEPNDYWSSCEEPSTELCRYSFVADEAHFSYPSTSTLYFPEPCCIYNPVYIGIVYTNVTGPNTPGLLFDDGLEMDICDNWFFLEGQADEFIEWDDLLGYPYFEVLGVAKGDVCETDIYYFEDGLTTYPHPDSNVSWHQVWPDDDFCTSWHQDGIAGDTVGYLDPTDTIFLSLMPDRSARKWVHILDTRHILKFYDGYYWDTLYMQYRGPAPDSPYWEAPTLTEDRYWSVVWPYDYHSEIMTVIGLEDNNGNGVLDMGDEIRLNNFDGDYHVNIITEVYTGIVVEEVSPPFLCGDANGSGDVDIDDVVYLIAYIFAGGPEPLPYENGDADCSGGIDIDDVVYLIAYIFSGGNAPCDTDGDEVPDC